MQQASYSVAEKADILHQLSSLYMSSNIPIDYGTGEKYTPVEVHMLEFIITNPGKTVTDLSQDWDKTKAAISQQMKKLEEKGLVHRTGARDSLKKQLYYATEKGERLNRLHLAYDTKIFGKTLEYVRRTHSDEEIDNCFRLLIDLSDALRSKHYHSDAEMTH